MLSADREITRQDYFWAASGCTSSRRMMELLLGRHVPHRIPAGTYYIGWLIDPDDRVKEASETNNMAVIEAGQLLVTDE
jgi:hypothetical protein